MPSNPPAPRVGQELALEIGALGDAGDGMARVGGFPVFVAGALPGEAVRARIVAVHEGHGRAELLAVERRSPDRVEPRCRHFGACAQCRLQHVADAPRRERKLQRLVAALGRHLKGDGAELGAVASPADAYATRCRIVIRFGRARSDLLAGLLGGAFDGTPLPIEECPATMPAAIAVARAIADEACARELRALRAVAVHAGSEGTQVHATLVADTARLPHAQRLADVARAAGATGMCLNQHDGREDRLFGRRTTALFGRAFLTEQIGAVRLRVSATTFFEASHDGARAMVDAVQRAADVAAGDDVLDLYSGAGLFALALGARGARVRGIESLAQAVHDANGSAHDAGLEGVTFVEERVEALLPNLGRPRPRIVVADPPRAGCPEEVVAGIARLLAPSRVVLVGREAGAFGRDLARFVALGYRATRVDPVETDPLSRELEAVATLVRDAS